MVREVIIMAKNTKKPYGRDIPEKSDAEASNELTGKFNKTTDDINSQKEVVKKTKIKK